MKKLIFIFIFIFLLNLEVKAPCWRIERMYVRLTAYSPKQRFEKSVNHKNKSIRNENGVAVPKGLIPDGTVVRLPNGDFRVVDDRVPRNVVDVRYYQSIKSKPKTRAVYKELCKKFGMGKDYIEVYYSD